MTPDILGILGIIFLLLIIFSGIPVAFGLMLVGYIGFSFLVSSEAALALIARDIWDTLFGYTFTVIPVFIFMGQICFNGKISRKLFATAYTCLGQFRGGIAIATIGASSCFAAICGSLTASTATMGAIALPEMKKYGYAPSLATGTVVSGGSLGPLIPPSIVFIIYGIMTEESIGKLFIAGIFPGILLASAFAATIYIVCCLNPKLGPAGPKTTFREKFLSIKDVSDMLILFLLVLGGLYFGWFSPTEAGAAGALGAIILTLIRRNLTWQSFVKSLIETAQISCMVLFLIIGATIFGHFLTVSNIPMKSAEFISRLNLPSGAILAGIFLVYAIAGCLMDGLAFLILTLPIFIPIAKAQGYDLIWFGVLITIVTNMGTITPPVGIGMYIVKGIVPEVPMETIYKGSLLFIFPFVFTLIILSIFPQISLFLPHLTKF